jgi:hypothetical protein
MSSEAYAGLLLIGLLLSARVEAQDVTAEQALATYHSMTDTAQKRCQKGNSKDDIIVCAADGQRFRLPLPDEREPRDGPRTATGEIPSATSSGPSCPPRGCPGGAKFMEAVGNLIKLGKAILGKDDD